MRSRRNLLCGSSGFAGMASKGSSSTHRLLDFMAPFQWWDERKKSQTNPSSRDFEHKIILESLCLDSLHDPSWVEDTLKKMESASKGMRKCKSPQPRRMLSLEQALTSLEQMPQPPSVGSLKGILHKVREKKNLSYVQRLCAYICKSGLEGHTAIGSRLVPMLVEVGNMCDAQLVFDKSVYRSEYCWTSLIMGYIECGESQHALNLYQKMQEDCVQPSGHTFVAVLKACARLKDGERGQEIHAEIVKMQWERDPFVGNTLVNMYAKCDSLAKAREVFEKLPVRDAVSWNALITAYAEHGLGEEALSCFEQMLLEGVSPDALTFICSLKACGSIGAIDMGQEIHVEIVRKGLLERDPFVGNALIDMYAKCGLLAKAQEVFDKLPVRDEVSWTALIAGYANHGLGDKMLNCFERMQLEGVSPDALMLVCRLKACGSTGALDRGQKIHAEIARRGLLESDLFVGSTLVDMYAKCGALEKARGVFDKLPVRNVVSWNALIIGYVKHGLGEEALKCFNRMQVEGVSPDAFTFAWSLKACGNIGALHKGQEIHAEIVRRGSLDRDFLVGCALVDMYATCGSLAKAREVFDKLPVRNVVSWNALITGYVKHKLGKEALDSFERMKQEGVSPDAPIYVWSLKACASIGDIDKGKEIHAEIARKGLDRDILVGSTLVDMYAKCGSPAKAHEAFDKLLARDVVAWTALIAGYAHVGQSENAFHLLERMRGEGIKPNRVTFLSILAVCSHTGLVDKGQKYFEAMSKDYGIAPTIKHHNCVVDLLGRAGQLNEAIVMMKQMPFHPNLVVWHTVLGACRKWGNVDVGRLAFEHAVQLDKKDTAAYVLMSNIYSDAHMPKKVKEIEAIRIEVQA